MILEKTIGLRRFVQAMGGALRATENRGKAYLIIICSQTNLTAQLRWIELGKFGQGQGQGQGQGHPGQGSECDL